MAPLTYFLRRAALGDSTELIAPMLDQLASDVESVSNAIYATRYLTIMGLVLLLHDHVITFRLERRLIWTAPRSVAKYAFMINRYLVPVALLVASLEMSGFSGVRLSDSGCQALLFALAMLAICSTAVANLLVLTRVILLWDGNRKAMLVMTAGFFLTFAATFVTAVLSLIDILPGILWSPVVNMCVATQTTPLLIATWASPMIFELLVLAAVSWNVFDRPREAHLPLRRALHRDGITFFAAVTLLRLLNVILAATQNPSLTLLAVFIVWALVTLTLNRLLLRLRRAELALDVPVSRSQSGRASPFAPRAVLPPSPSPLPDSWALDVKAAVARRSQSPTDVEWAVVGHGYRELQVGTVETVVDIQ